MKKEEILREIEVLDTEGYLEYGAIIPKERMEKIIGLEASEEWNYKGPLLLFLMELSEMGHLCTTSGVELGGLRIYDVDEVCYECNKRFEQSLRKMSRIKKCITNVNMEEFGDKDVRKLMHTTNKIVAGLRAMKSSLNDI